MFIGSRPDDSSIYCSDYYQNRGVSLPALPFRQAVKCGLFMEEFLQTFISVDFDSLFLVFFNNIEFLSRTTAPPDRNSCITND